MLDGQFILIRAFTCRTIECTALVAETMEFLQGMCSINMWADCRENGRCFDKKKHKKYGGFPECKAYNFYTHIGKTDASLFVVDGKIDGKKIEG